jgi:hypothetical protein
MKEKPSPSFDIEGKSILQAVVSAFDVLGPITRQKLLVHLKEECGIDIIESATEFELKKIEHAIERLFGHAAASLLMKLVYSKISCQSIDIQNNTEKGKSNKR